MIRLTRAQVREIDRRSIHDYHIPGVVLMENAALAVADAAGELSPAGDIAVLCGGGNNGGDGLAAARHLHNRGRAVTIVLGTDPTAFSGDALTQWEITRAMRLPVVRPDPSAGREGLDALRSAGLIIDALFGTGLSAPPRPAAVPLIEACHRPPPAGPVLAVDVPSGLDCDTGRPLGPCVRATHTVTFVAEKVGFAHPAARPFLGAVMVASIGCPRELIEQIAAPTSSA